MLPLPVPAAAICLGLLVWPQSGLQVIADTRGAYRVLETHHPPTYYLPPADVNTQLLNRSAGASACVSSAVQRQGGQRRAAQCAVLCLPCVLGGAQLPAPLCQLPPGAATSCC